MDDQPLDSKAFTKNIVKGFFQASPFDPDMKEEKVNQTPEFTTKQLVDNAIRKEKLSSEEVEQLKTARKYVNFL